MRISACCSRGTYVNFFDAYDRSAGAAPTICVTQNNTVSIKNMIKITDIQDPIAEDVWTLKRSDGQIVSHRIIVGRPQPETEGDGHSDWYCPIMIEGFLPRVVPAMGVGPVDSLMNAMHLVKTFFDKNKDHFEEIGNNANKVVERNVANASSLTTDVGF